LTCPACTEAATTESHQFANGCKGCVARGLARIFLRKGERGRKLRMAAEQAGVTVDEVHHAWRRDRANPEAKL
jgi:hypothetical protein